MDRAALLLLRLPSRAQLTALVRWAISMLTDHAIFLFACLLTRVRTLRVCLRSFLLQSLLALTRWVVSVLSKLAVRLEEDEWLDDTSATAAQQFSHLLEGGTLDALETMPQALASPEPPPDRHRRHVPGTRNPDGRMRRNTRNLRPLVPRADELYGAHLLPKFLASSLEELRPFIESHRGANGWDWQLLHLAAAAGRVDVARYLCVECHLPITLRNRKGRNVVAAAIDHRRLDFISWVLYGKEEDFGGVTARSSNSLHRARERLGTCADPARGNKSPLLSAARRLDLPLLRVLLNADAADREERKARSLALMGLGGPKRIEEALHMVYRQPTRGRVLPRRKNEALQLLLRALREYDLDYGLFGEAKTLSVHDDEAQTDGQVLASLQSGLAKCVWAKVSQDALPWNRTELLLLYGRLRHFVEEGYVGCARWLLEAWGVKPHPPPGSRIRTTLADHALGSEALQYMEDVRAEEPKDPDEKDQRLTGHVLSRWDGASAASLAAAAGARLDNIWTEHEQVKATGSTLYNSWDQIRQLRSLSLTASGRARSGHSFDLGRAEYVDESRHVDMLSFLTTRLGISGAPQLKVVMCTGLVWPLRWLVEQDWLSLTAPIGGVARAAEEESDVCPLCLSPFTAPVALACGHELCRMCARRFFSSERQAADEEAREAQAQLPCPMCRTMVSPPDTVPTDLVAAFADELEEFAPWLHPTMAASSEDAPSWLSSAMPVGNVLAALATRIGALAVLEFVAQHQPPIDLCMVYGDGSTLLHFAAAARKFAVVKWLVANGYGATMAVQKDARGDMPLHCACRSGDVSSCQLLLTQPDAYAPTAIYGSDVEGDGGWVDQLLSSPHEKVQTFGREHLQRVASKHALELLPRIIAEGGTLAAVAGVEPALKVAFERICNNDCFRDRDASNEFLTREDVKGQDAFAVIVELATEAGRVDIVRWLFSPRRDFAHHFCLDRNLIPRYEVDENHKCLTPTYEQFGREAAERHGHPEFTELFDVLRLAQKGDRALFQQSEDLMKKIAEGAAVSEIEAASALVVATRDEIPDDLIAERRSEVGLSYLLSQRSSRGYGRCLRIEGCGTFTVRNLVAIRGYMHLLEWLLAMPGVIGVTEALDMFERSVRHSEFSMRSADVQHRLIAWLAEKHGYTDFSGVAPLRNWATDDSHRGQESRPDGSSLPESYYTSTHSLLDSAVHGLVLMLNYGEPEMRDPKPIWSTIELLSALQPAIPCNLSLLYDQLRGDTHYFKCLKGEAEGFIGFRARCEPHVLRLLQLFSARGHDLTAPVSFEFRNRPTQMPVSHLLINGGWIDCLAWLVEQHPSINVQTPLEFSGELYVPKAEREEWLVLNQQKLAAIRAAQRAGSTVTGTGAGEG